jgi:D-glycero-D-manno-heptose 1,7-bisphosphate phosphatase
MQRTHNLLTAEGLSLAEALCCPHSPDAGCSCRQPQPGLLIQAQMIHDIDLRAIFIVGDKLSDREAGAILVARPSCSPLNSMLILC